MKDRSLDRLTVDKPTGRKRRLDTGAVAPSKRRKTDSRDVIPPPSPTDSLWNTYFIQRQRVSHAVPGVPMGNGTLKDPFRIPLRTEANESGCVHCPLGIETCECVEIEALISKQLNYVYANTKMRRTHAFGHHPLNSKSVLPVFVSRLARISTVRKDDVVWDLGCGIGSVVMQFALQTGASAVGVDIQKENIAIAKKTWLRVRKEWSKRHPGRAIGDVQFISNDMFAELAPFVRGAKQAPQKKRTPRSPTVVWAANLLFTAEMNNTLGQTLHRIQSLRSVSCMVDLYPHNRPGAAKKRNPEPYEKFQVMQDHMSQADCYEWTEAEKRLFFAYHTENPLKSRADQTNHRVASKD